MACKTIKTLPFNDRAFAGTALAAFIFGASICSEAPHAQGATEPIWPTKEWQTSSPEEQGVDSKELAKLVDFGTTSSFDSLLVVRHGKIVAEAYYAPYDAGIPHQMYSATKAIVSTLTAIAWRGLSGWRPTCASQTRRICRLPRTSGAGYGPGSSVTAI